MFFFVKTKVQHGKVDELTRKIANNELSGVQGNMSYVTEDGMVGYDIVECRDENECHQKYSQFQGYLTVEEMTPIMPMGQFIEHWKRNRAA